MSDFRLIEMSSQGVKVVAVSSGVFSGKCSKGGERVECKLGSSCQCDILVID